MAYNKSVKKRTEKRAMRVRARIKKNAHHPRVVVFRSLKHIYAQIIDQSTGVVLASCSSLQLDASDNKTNIAHTIGKKLANQVIQQGVSAATFDRGHYLYHGRVRALAEGLREGGLNI